MAYDFDYLLIDTQAGIGSEVMYFNSAATEIMCIISHEPSSLTDAYALIKVLSLNHRRRHFHIMANLVQNEREARNTFNTFQKVAHQFLTVSLHYLGAVPHDPEVKRAVREQTPFLTLAPRSPATQSVLQLAEHLRAGLPVSPEKAGQKSWTQRP